MQYKPVTSRLEALRAAHRATVIADLEFSATTGKDPKVVDAAWQKLVLAEAAEMAIINRCD